MQVLRVLRHLFYFPHMVQRAFPLPCRTAITQAIQASELLHAGEIRFVVEGGLEGWPLFKGQTPRERALELFSMLRVWDTEHNNGVLIYVLLADHAVEIVADRGIHARVDENTWAAICQHMQDAFVRGDFQAGSVGGIEALSRVLQSHFPARGDRPNELSDAPVIIG